MSSQRSYSREARSHYSRSSSFGDNRSISSSNRSRPLSALLIERDFSSPSLARDSFDDPDFFERRTREIRDDIERRFRSRFNDDFFDDDFFKGNNSIDFGQQRPINNREYNSSSSTTRNIPVQYAPSSNNHQEKVYRKIDDYTSSTSNSSQWNNGSFNKRENRYSMNDWPSNQETPTRKRTSLTIFLKQPRMQYSDVSQNQQPNYYSTSNRANY